MFKKRTVLSFCIFSLLVFAAALIDRNPLPDFSKYTQAQQKKRAFFEYILPLVQESNGRVIADRKALELLAENSAELNFFQRRDLYQLAKKYFVSLEEKADSQVIEQLMLRVDPVPASLALAQAAIESAWGTSRFAVQGNNLFGQWCYTRGCGMVPRNREAGRQHEVAKFSTVSESVESYIRNINTHRAYSDLRLERARLRAAENSASGYQLAENLLQYSELREKYVRKVKLIIRTNNLARFDGL